MLVNKLETMEQIVAKNDNLHWDGWDVFSLKKNAGAMMSKDGVYVNGNWYLKTKFNLSEIGWDIPSKFMR